MKPFRILYRNIRDALKSIFRNFSLSIASISCITITLIIVAISMILSFNVENVTNLIRKDFTIIAFLDNKLTEEEIKQVEEKITKLDNIDEYKYENKIEIAESMQDSSDVFKTIMENWDEEDNPLQDTFLIKVVDAENINITANELKKIEGITVVRYGEGIVENLLSVFGIVEKSLIVIVLALIVVTAFLISNTIKLTIFSRKREIEIMRLVGASNLNIKLPFIIEGLFLGVLGSLIPIILVIYGYRALFKYFEGQVFTPFLQLVQPLPFVYIVSSLLALIGVFVGMWGSARAVKKYLKI